MGFSPNLGGGLEVRVVGDSITTGRIHIRDGGGAMIGSFGGILAPLELASGHLVAYGYWPTNVDDPDEAIRRQLESGERLETEYANSLDFFDADGRYLGSIRRDGTSRPEIGSLALVGPDGKLYTTLSDPFPQARRYRVEIDS